MRLNGKMSKSLCEGEEGGCHRNGNKFLIGKYRYSFRVYDDVASWGTVSITLGLGYRRTHGSRIVSSFRTQIEGAKELRFTSPR